MTRRERDALAREHQGRVRAIAAQHTSRRFPIADLVSEGNVGLLRALDTYDPERGASLATWIDRCVRWAILDAITEAKNRDKHEQPMADDFDTEADSSCSPSHASVRLDLRAACRAAALTARELDVMERLADGQEQHVIADALGLTPTRISQLMKSALHRATAMLPEVRGEVPPSIGKIDVDS